ncbi:hypothetical protein OROGR_000519 [Orobanche gracilis]
MKTPSFGSLIAKTLQGHADVYLIDPSIVKSLEQA